MDSIPEQVSTSHEEEEELPEIESFSCSTHGVGVLVASAFGSDCSG